MAVEVARRILVSTGPLMWGRIVAGAQFLFLGLLLVGLAPMYLHALGVAGSREALVTHPAQPVLPFGDSAANPFVWIYPFVAIATVFGVVIGALLGVTGLALSLLSDLRRARRLEKVLLIASVLCAAATIVLVTPFGEDLQRWFLN